MRGLIYCGTVVTILFLTAGTTEAAPTTCANGQCQVRTPVRRVVANAYKQRPLRTAFVKLFKR